MKTISRYIMTLALLLTAVTGAWAEEKSETISTTTSQKVYTGEHFKITPNREYYMLAVADLRNYADGQVFFFIETLDGQNISKLDLQINDIDDTSIDNLSLSSGTKSYDSNTKVLTITNVNAATVQITLTDGDQYGEVTISSVTYYYEESPSGPEVAWDPATKTGTFEMPANDVVLTPVYAEATIYQNDGETEKQAYASLKEAFAAVQEGDVIKLDWNVTLTETVETLLRDGAIKFTLDLNGYIIDGTTPEDAIRLRNGDYMTITDSSLGQTGGLKCQNSVGEYGAKFIFDGGRYTIGQFTADFLNTVCSGATAALLLAPGKEFTDIENAPDADGFTLRVGFKTFDLAIDSKRFATFYSDMNIKLAEQTAEGVGLYTIRSIDADRSTATVTPISGIIPAGTPMLVYNDTEQEQTAKLIVTLDNAQNVITWAIQFKGTATDHEFTADDMAAADYYALSGGKAFAPVKGAGTLGANQCWLQFDKQEIPSARQFTLVFDETTGLSEELRVKSEEFATATWYTLDGRKIAAPSKKGIYVNNGRKFVVK